MRLMVSSTASLLLHSNTIQLLGFRQEGCDVDAAFFNGTLRGKLAVLCADETLWSGPTGLCISFSIRVATDARVANIQYSNLGRHRAGWELSGTSAVVKDSSARQVTEFKDTRIGEIRNDLKWQGETMLFMVKHILDATRQTSLTYTVERR